MPALTCRFDHYVVQAETISIAKRAKEKSDWHRLSIGHRLSREPQQNQPGEDQPGEDQPGEYQPGEDQFGEDQTATGEQFEDGVGPGPQDADQFNASTSPAAAQQSGASSSELHAHAGKQPEAIWISNPNIPEATKAESDPQVSKDPKIKGNENLTTRKNSKLNFNLAEGQVPSRSPSTEDANLGSYTGPPSKRNSSVSKKPSVAGSSVRSRRKKSKMNVDNSTMLKEKTSNALQSTSTYLRCYNGNSFYRNKGEVSGDVTCSDIPTSAVDCGKGKRNHDSCHQTHRSTYSGYNKSVKGCSHGYNPELSSVTGAARFSAVPKSDADSYPQVIGRFSRASRTDYNRNNRDNLESRDNRDNRDGRDETEGTSRIKPNTEDSGWNTDSDTPRDEIYESNCDFSREMRSHSAYLLECPDKSDI